MRSWKGRWALLTAFFISIACGQDRVQLCAACHGDDGNSTNPQIPSIAGQPKLFLENQLILFREELRKSEQMAPVVKGMKDPEIIKLAEHFSKLPAKVMESAPADPALVKQGTAKASNCAAASATSPISAARTRSRASQVSARRTSTRRCAPTATASERAATPSWPPPCMA